MQNAHISIGSDDSDNKSSYSSLGISVEQQNSRSAAPSLTRSTSPTRPTGAVVVGGCFQGLGIVRSLGRHGVPVCVIDDESSISRFSRYTTHAVRVTDLRDEQQTVDTVLDVGRRLGLENWVLFPTRDETVAAFSR